VPARLAVLHHLAQPFLGQAERPLRAAGLEIEERRLAEFAVQPLDLGRRAGVDAVEDRGAQRRSGRIRRQDARPDAAEAHRAHLLRAVG
jgi:hypothetical protein